MQQIDKVLDAVRKTVRTGARQFAKFLNFFTLGKITPNAITYTSLMGHLPVAFLIASNHFVWAAIALVVFGLMDTLDGELARLQESASPAGMLLDASTDRMKEALIYIAIAYVAVATDQSHLATWAAATLSGSMLVSYIKAKGETAVISQGASHSTVNKLFSDGLMRYEVRMFVLIIGLLTSYLTPAVIILAVLAWGTALKRLYRISNYLKRTSHHEL